MNAASSDDRVGKDSGLPEYAQKRPIPGRIHVIDENHSVASTVLTDSMATSPRPAHGYPASKFASQYSASTCITDMESDSPFSDHNSVIDAMPLPHGAGMPPVANGSRVSMNLSGSITPTTVTPKGSTRNLSPFSDDNEVERTPRLR